MLRVRRRRSYLSLSQAEQLRQQAEAEALVEQTQEDEAALSASLAAALEHSNASAAWLGEEIERLQEENSHLESQAEVEARQAAQHQAKADEALGHLRSLRGRITKRDRHASAVRATLEQAHIATAQQLQQLLATVERKLEAESAVLEPGARARLLAKLKASADNWLREAAETAAQLQLTQANSKAGGSEVDGAEGGAEGAVADEDATAVSSALQAAAHSRGALVDRLNAGRLEVKLKARTLPSSSFRSTAPSEPERVVTSARR